jgi:glycerophosphoryl diester phosphodiesterase
MKLTHETERAAVEVAGADRPGEGFIATAAWIARRLQARWLPAGALAIAVHLLQVTLFAPLLAGVLRLFLLRWGRASVGNFEIVSFLVSPVGIAALLSFGGLWVATLYFEVSGLLRLLASDRLLWWQALRSSTGLLPRLIGLGLRQLAVYLALAAPFLVGIGCAYWYFWSGSDLNSLTILRPPHFWRGAIVAGVLVSIYLALALLLFCRWLYAVPILCLEPARSAREALRESARRARGTFWQTALALCSWLAFTVAFNALVLLVVNWLLSVALGSGDVSLTRACAVGALVVLVHAGVTSALAIGGSLTFATLILALYHRVSPTTSTDGDIVRTSKAPALRPWQWMGGAVALSLVALTTGPGFVSDLPLAERVEITAHRAGAARGPENTLAALRAAIEDGADWAEIDVQLTSDMQLAVLHDTDLARIGGGTRGVDQVTLAELQELDVGTSINSKFARERVPTLQEMLAVAKERIRLNVELKPHSAEDVKPLTERVVREIQQARMVDQCRICAQSYEGIQLARQLEPKLPIGLIISSAIGDPARLPVDFLMLRGKLATPSFVERARAARIGVHVWTVNDSAAVPPLVDSGADNIITDDVPAIRRKLAEIEALPPVQRLLLRVRHTLAR